MPATAAIEIRATPDATGGSMTATPAISASEEHSQRPSRGCSAHASG